MERQEPKEYQSLYEITGNIADFNTLLVNRAFLLSLFEDSEKLEQMLDDAGIS